MNRYVVRWTDPRVGTPHEQAFPHDPDWQHARMRMIDFIRGLHPEIEIEASIVYEDPLKWVSLIQRGT
jgi:hypothetical protein